MATYTKSFIESSFPVVPTVESENDKDDAESSADRVWAFNPPATYLDETGDAADADADDVIVVTASSGYLYIGCAVTFKMVKIDITTAGIGTYTTLATEYWNGSVWGTISEGGEFQPIDFKTIDLLRIAFQVPDNWAKCEVNGDNKYWIRVPVSAGTVTTQALAGQIWVKLTAVPHTQDWFDTLTIPSDSVSWAQGHVKGFGDSEAIADAGALSWIQNFGRSFTDQLGITDTASFVHDFVRSFTDQLLISDGLQLNENFVRSFNDIMLITDSLKKDVSKTFADLITIVASLYFGSNILIADQLGITDQLVFTVNRLFGDTVIIGDVLVRHVDKFFADNMTLADAFSLTPHFHWSDIIDIADTLVKSLSIVEPPSDVVDTLVNPALLTGPWMPYIAVGTSNITQDQVIGRITELFAEVHRKKANVRVIANTYFASAEFGQDEPTADDLLIYEIGLFDSPTDGNMAARWVLGTGISKDNIDEFVIETAITILHGSIYIQELSFTGEVGAGMIASILAAGGSSVAGAKDTQTISDTLTWKLN